LKLAWELLCVKKALTGQQAVSILLGSLSSAHACAYAINLRATSLERFRTQAELCSAFVAIANCAKRAPAKLRRRLNENLTPLIQEDSVDLEVIDSIFATAAGVFAEFPDSEPAKTALRRLSGAPSKNDRELSIIGEYAALDALRQRKAEEAIAHVATRSGDAADVFNALASALDSDHSRGPTFQIHQHIVNYVADVASLWRLSGLRPARAWHEADPDYAGPFHRFVDLVLTEAIEPWSQRHRMAPNAIRRDLTPAHARGARIARQKTDPRKSDLVLLVSDDHIKKALRRRPQKRPPHTPYAKIR
jgi:hypothetical protein